MTALITPLTDSKVVETSLRKVTCCSGGVLGRAASADGMMRAVLNRGQQFPKYTIESLAMELQAAGSNLRVSSPCPGNVEFEL